MTPEVYQSVPLVTSRCPGFAHPPSYPERPSRNSELETAAGEPPTPACDGSSSPANMEGCDPHRRIARGADAGRGGTNFGRGTPSLLE